MSRIRPFNDLSHIAHYSKYSLVESTMMKIIFINDGYHFARWRFFVPLVCPMFKPMNKTNFYICCNDTIAEIKGRFSQFYPSFEINFFSNNEKTQSNNSCVLFSPEVRIRDINPDCPNGYIELNDKMTMDELENLIHDRFGLHAEIQPTTRGRIMSSLWINKNPTGVRLPERSDAAYGRFHGTWPVRL